MGFHDQILCDLFNQGLKQVHQSGEYSYIYQKYSLDLNN